MHVKSLKSLGTAASLAGIVVLMAGCSEAPRTEKAAAKADDVRGTPINAPSTPAPTAAPTSAGVAATAAVPKPVKGDDYTLVGFDKLAGYNFDLPDELLAPQSNKLAEASLRTSQQIPGLVKAFDQKRVALKGFMLPLKVKDGLVTELLIMRDQSMCCYGTVPKINEWVSVKMSGEGVKPVMDQAVTLYGKLHVGEMRENGYLIGIYALDGDKMAAPDTL